MPMDRRIKLIFLAFITLWGIVGMCTQPVPASRELGVVISVACMQHLNTTWTPLHWFFIFGDFFNFSVFTLMLPQFYTERT